MSTMVRISPPTDEPAPAPKRPVMSMAMRALLRAMHRTGLPVKLSVSCNGYVLAEPRGVKDRGVTIYFWSPLSVVRAAMEAGYIDVGRRLTRAGLAALKESEDHNGR